MGSTSDDGGDEDEDEDEEEEDDKEEEEEEEDEDDEDEGEIAEGMKREGITGVGSLVVVLNMVCMVSKFLERTRENPSGAKKAMGSAHF